MREYHSETQHYGLTDQDWIEAQEELNHLGLSDTHQELNSSINFYNDQHENYDSINRVDPIEESTNFDWNLASNQHLDSDDISSNYHTLQTSTSENLTPDRWSSDPDSSHSTSIYTPTRSHYDEQQFTNHDIDTPGSDFDRSNLSGATYLGDDHYIHTPLVHSKSVQSHDHFNPRDDRYTHHLHHYLHQNEQNLSNSLPSQLRTDDYHSPRNFDSDFLDSLGSTSHTSDLPHEFRASPNHDQIHSDGSFPNNSIDDSNWTRHSHYTSNDYPISPQTTKRLDASFINKSSFHDDNVDSSLAFHDPMIQGNIPTNCEDQSFSHHNPDYTTNEIGFYNHQSRLTPGSYIDDPFNFPPGLNSTLRSKPYHRQSSVEIGGEMRSKVDRTLLEPLNELQYHERSSTPVNISEPSYLTQRNEIERIRAQLDLSTLSELNQHIGAESSFPLSRESMSSHSGRRSPHPKYFDSNLKASMMSLVEPSSMDSPCPRSMTPLSVASSYCPPHSDLIWDSRSTSGHCHTTDPLLPQQTSLSHQLREISDLTREIRRSEQAHQQELAEINQVTSQLAQQSLEDNLHQDDVNYQIQLSLANQHAALENQYLDRDIRRSGIAYQQDLALADQRSAQPFSIQNVHENQTFRELNQHRHQLDLQRAELDRQHNRVDTESQINLIDRQLRAIDYQREIDSNRQLANLTRYGNLPSVLKGNYAGRPLASPYLQQSRLLSAMRRWSDRDKSRHNSPIVYDHIDAYYSLMSDHLPKSLPMFHDPYDRHGLQLPHTGTRSKVGLTPFTKLDVKLRADDPFIRGIDYDYGFGRVGSLGLKYEQFAREQAYILDDLYLYELMLRLDQSIDEVERQRRWRLRLRWEEWKDNRSRVEAWKMMSARERKSLGLSEGSYWASNLFGIPLDSRFGYTNYLNAHQYRPNDLRTHYTLTSSLLSRFPMWKRGGLGLGRRVANWYDLTRRPTHHKSDLGRDFRFQPSYNSTRKLSNDPRLIPNNLISESHPPNRFGGSLATSNTLNQYLPPSTPLLPTSLSNNGISRVSSSLSKLSKSHVTSNLENASTIGMTSFKESSNKFPASVSSNININSNTTGHVSRASKDLAATDFKNPNGKPVVTKRPVPLKPSSLPISSHSDHSQSMSKTPKAHTRNSSRPRTPSGASSKQDNPIHRSTTPSVVFNPRVIAVPPESESDPLPIPRPPSRSSTKPSLSVLKVPQSSKHNSQNSSYPENKNKNLDLASILNLGDDKNLDLITKINTERNRSTPAPPEAHDNKDTHYTRVVGSSN